MTVLDVNAARAGREAGRYRTHRSVNWNDGREILPSFGGGSIVR